MKTGRDWGADEIMKTVTGQGTGGVREGKGKSGRISDEQYNLTYLKWIILTFVESEWE